MANGIPGRLSGVQQQLGSMNLNHEANSPRRMDRTSRVVDSRSRRKSDNGDSENDLEGYTLRKASDGKSWDSVDKISMPYSSRDLRKMVQDQRREGTKKGVTIHNRLKELRSDQQNQVHILIEDMNEEDPDVVWKLVYLDRKQKKVGTRGLATVVETSAISVILERTLKAEKDSLRSSGRYHVVNHVVEPSQPRQSQQFPQDRPRMPPYNAPIYQQGQVFPPPQVQTMPNHNNQPMPQRVQQIPVPGQAVPPHGVPTMSHPQMMPSHGQPGPHHTQMPPHGQSAPVHVQGMPPGHQGQPVSQMMPSQPQSMPNQPQNIPHGQFSPHNQAMPTQAHNMSTHGQPMAAPTQPVPQGIRNPPVGPASNAQFEPGAQAFPNGPNGQTGFDRPMQTQARPMQPQMQMSPPPPSHIPPVAPRGPPPAERYHGGVPPGGHHNSQFMPPNAPNPRMNPGPRVENWNARHDLESDESSESEQELLFSVGATPESSPHTSPQSVYSSMAGPPTGHHSNRAPNHQGQPVHNRRPSMRQNSRAFREHRRRPSESSQSQVFIEDEIDEPLMRRSSHRRNSSGRFSDISHRSGSMRDEHLRGSRRRRPSNVDHDPYDDILLARQEAIRDAIRQEEALRELSYEEDLQSYRRPTERLRRRSSHPRVGHSRRDSYHR